MTVIEYLNLVPRPRCVILRAICSLLNSAKLFGICYFSAVDMSLQAEAVNEDAVEKVWADGTGVFASVITWKLVDLQQRKYNLERIATLSTV